jgi:ribonuclease HII
MTESKIAPTSPDHRAAEGLVFGVDEAGRGPWLGPMAIAVAVVDARGRAKLEALGVQDSKRFGAGARGRARRRELADAIREHAVASRCTLVDVEEIDRYTFRGHLNVLEREVVARLLDELDSSIAARIICDGARLFSPLTRRFPTLEAVDHGESAHVSVAAASVLAKHARDEAFHEIATKYEPEYGPIKGGGYVNAATKRFLHAYRARHGGLPPEARKSWGARKQKAQQLPLTLR